MTISIITINFNDLQGLKRTVESVINQSYTELEYIIIDGGSTDGSAEFLEENKSHFSYWVSELDRGIYHAMNKGIAKTTGEYILFLNSGDWLYNDNVIEDFKQLNPTEDIIYGNVVKIYESGGSIYDRGFARSFLTLGDMFFGTIFHQSSFIKRSLFSKYGDYDEDYKIVGDWAFFLKVIGIEGCQVKYIDSTISYIDMNGISNSNNGLLKKEREQELIKIIPKNIYSDYIRLQKSNKKAAFYDRIKSNKPLWFFIRIFNKLFSIGIWNK